MRVTFYGVRGSLPVPGPATCRYGGNTPCVAVRSDSGQTLVLDAGTGIRELGNALMGQGTPVEVTLLIIAVIVRVGRAVVGMRGSTM